MNIALYHLGRSCHWFSPPTPLKILLALAMLIGAGICFGAPGGLEAATTTGPAVGGIGRPAPNPAPAPLSFRFTAPPLFARPSSDPGGTVSLMGGIELDHDGLVKREPGAERGLIGRYREALIRESHRTLRKEPYLFWIEPQGEEDLLFHRAQKRAEKIFDGAHGRMLSDLVDSLIENTKPLRVIHRYIEGIDFGRDREEERSPYDSAAARSVVAPSAPETSTDTDLKFVVSTNPRMKLSSWLPGRIKARVEVPLASPGVRASFSRELAPNMSCTLSAAVEDGGEESWVSARLRLRF